VDDLDLSPHGLQRTAQQGDLKAIAQILRHITTEHSPQVKVRRQAQTLRVDLADFPPDRFDHCALMIYSALYALGVDGMTHLVVAGFSRNNHRQHQQTFMLSNSGGYGQNGLHGEGRNDSEVPLIHRFPWVGNPLLPVTSLPDPYPDFDPRQPPLEVTTQVSLWPNRWRLTPSRQRWLQWSVILTLSFILGAGMARWYHSQRRSATRALVPDTSQHPAPQDKPDSLLANPANASAPSPPGVAKDTPVPPIAPLGQALTEPPVMPDSVPVVTLKAVGDIIMGTNYPRPRMPEDWQYFFDGIKLQLEEADLVFGNYESTLTEVPHSAKDTSRPMTFAFRSPPWYASVLRAAGFDVLNVANNHSMDFFDQGFNDTIAHIESEGMVAVGRKGEIQYTEVNGLRVAFIGFSYLPVHNTVHDLDTAGVLVQEAEQTADIVVVSVHAGREGTDAVYSRNQDEFFDAENRGNLVHFSRTVVDYGADLVLGHGPHVPRALELYNSRLIAYSLGNFLGYRTLSTEGPLGLSMILQASINRDGHFVDGRIIPAALDPNGVPYLDNHFGSVILVRNATRRDFPDTPLEIDDLGYILRRN